MPIILALLAVIVGAFLGLVLCGWAFIFWRMTQGDVAAWGLFVSSLLWARYGYPRDRKEP
jgi:hypothetical protein